MKSGDNEKIAKNFNVASLIIKRTEQCKSLC